jgi:hypothetical protein
MKLKMQQKSYQHAATMLVAIVVLILPASLSAQSFWLERSPGKTLALEIFKPTLHSGVYNGVSYPADYSFQTSAFFFSLRWPVGSKTFLVAELPFAHAAFDTKIDRPFSFFRNSGHESTIGNPYLGLEIGGKASRFFAEAGFRLPLVSSERGFARLVGQNSDPVRDEAFLDFTVVKAMINYRLKRETGLVFRLRLGAAALRNFETHSYGFSFPLDILIGYKTERLSAGAYIPIKGGFIKTSRRTESAFTRGSDFSFKMNQQEGIWANIRLGKLQPGVYIDPSFDGDVINTFAINLGIRLQ